MNNLRYLLLWLTLLPATLWAQREVRAPDGTIDSLPQLIARFRHAPQRALPYGSEKIRYRFPTYWENDPYKGIMTKHDTALNALGASIEDRADRLTIGVPYRIARELVDSAFIAFPYSVKAHGADLSLQVAAIAFPSQRFTLFSVRYEGYDTQYGGEYPLNQSHNLLITVDSDNRIVDRMLIDSTDVSLDGEATYGYIDSAGTILLKDFSLGELSVYFRGERACHISPQGQFMEVDPSNTLRHVR